LIFGLGRLGVCASLAVFFTLVQHAAIAAPPAIAGTWYGEGQPNDPDYFWVAHFYPGGNYEAHFRVCRGNQTSEDVNKGIWTYSGHVNDVVTLEADGHSMYRDDRYDTISIDAKSFVYRHEATGYVFTARRVDDKFQLPSCAAVS
jgi:hypothetical protein